jgi:tetratricopeptide (TPR) repeat protein
MRKQILILSALFLSLTVFGQKSELKLAEKAIKSNNFTEALNVLNSAESLFANADQKYKAKYYYLKAKAVFQNGNNTNYGDVGNAFNKLLDYEKNTKQKYTNEIGGLANELIQKVAEIAQNDYQQATVTKAPADYAKAAKGFEQVYALSPQDTSFLDNAALLYFFGEEYDASKEAYQKLLDLNYTGISTVYKATNKETGKEDTFGSKKDMDLQIKLGLYENPREELKESRRSNIFKNYAQSYVKQENYDKALEIISKGREEFPDSYALLIDEANVYYKKGDNVGFTERLQKAIELNPTEPTLYYNVGVMNMDQKKIDEAISYFKKAIELKPDYVDAYNNIGAAIIEKTEPIIEEMNKSLSDFDKYDKLQAQQLEIYREALPYYEKAHELDGENISVIQTLIGLYENLGEDEKRNVLKEKYDQMKG